MKRFIFTIIISALTIAGAAHSASAQNKGDEGWKEKMLSEKIAFFTMELDITPEEAQVFWPIYNKVEQDRDEARVKAIDAHRAMEKAVSEGKPSKEISELLDSYIDAKKNQDDVEISSVTEFKKVLPVEKVARLYMAEEKFRRQYIHKLHKGPADKKK